MEMRLCRTFPPPDRRQIWREPKQITTLLPISGNCKTAPDDSQGIYLNSLRALGIDLVKHDVRFVEDDWESPSLGATGLGWEIWLDGMEITQFTYFQQVGGFELEPITLELTYGLERIAMFIQEKESVFDLEWVEGYTYGDIHKQDEEQFLHLQLQSCGHVNAF